MSCVFCIQFYFADIWERHSSRSSSHVSKNATFITVHSIRHAELCLISIFIFIPIPVVRLTRPPAERALALVTSETPCHNRVSPTLQFVTDIIDRFSRFCRRFYLPVNSIFIYKAIVVYFVPVFSAVRSAAAFFRSRNIRRQPRPPGLIYTWASCGGGGADCSPSSVGHNAI